MDQLWTVLRAEQYLLSRLYNPPPVYNAIIMQWMRRARAPRLRSLIFPPNKKKDTARKTSFFFPCLITLSLFLIYFLFLKSSKRNEIIFNSCFYANSITWTESNTWIVSAMRRWSISDRESEIIARWPTPSRHFNSIYSRKFELSRRVPSSSIIRNTRGRDNCAPAPIIPPIFLFSTRHFWPPRWNFF